MEELPYFNTIVAEKESYGVHFKAAAFYQSIAKAGLAYVSKGEAGAIYAAAKELILVAKQPQDKVEIRVFKLFSNALKTACLYSFLHPNVIQYTLYYHQFKKLIQTIDENILTLELSFSLETLNNIDFHQSPALTTIIENYQQWLINAVHLKEQIAQQITNHVKTRFLDFLEMEWASKPDYYNLIEKTLNNPISKQRLERGYLLNYYEKLKQLYHQPALGDELLPLSKIYQEPDFLVYEKCLEKALEEANCHQDNFVNTNHLYQSLHEYITTWLNKEVSSLVVKGKQLLVLLGQPGQGKSSFCYKTLSLLLENPASNKQVYFIRLRDLSTKAKLIQEPFEVFKDHLKKKTKLSTINFEQSILIIDGLDELYMSDGLTNQDLKCFYERLEHKAEQEENLQLILTSRYNYLNTAAIDKDITTIVKIAPLSLAKQKAWLNIYKEVDPSCLLTTNKLEEINKEETLKHIRELIEQPILLHLIVKAEVEIDSKLDRAKIYEELFDTLIQRSWAGTQLKKFKPLTEEKHKTLFRQWLQEIAFTIYQSDQEYILYDEIINSESTNQLNEILATPKEMQDALKDLLVAFYFRNVATTASAHPVEFLHKSLQEYLATEYIWREITTLTSSNSMSDIELFQQLFNLFHKKGYNNSIETLLVAMITQGARELRKTTRARLKEIFPICLQHQFLYTYQTNEVVQKPLKSIEHCFRFFWLVLASLAADKSNNEDLIEEEFQGDFVSLLKVFGGYRMNLSYLNLIGADLIGADLRGANLRGANLRGADLRGADLRGADLSEAYLRGADLSEAYLSEAYLSEANLREANLRGADLRGANLIGAYLIGADLREANLIGANLRGADLREANLRGADLRGADLREADLRGADLRGANLSEAYLRGANLSGANLIGADLIGAKTDKLNFFPTLKQKK